MKPKLLLILHLPPPIHGAALMGQCIKESELINSTFECKYINLTTASSLSNIGKFSIKKIFEFIKLLFKIFKIIINFKPNLVYITPNSHGKALIKDLIVVALLKILCCKKIIAHYHNKGGAGINRFFKTKVILLSERLYGDFKKYVQREDLYILPNGIPKKTENSNNSVNPSSNNIPSILFLSNLIKSKGVFILLEACKILFERNLKFECIFAGANGNVTPDNSKIQKILNQTNNCIKFVGAVYGERKYKLLKDSDIFCFPTFYSKENFPLVLLEAMQAELPVIAVNVGGIPDIIENGINGFLIEKQNALATANALAILLNDKVLREKMGKAGKEKFDREYTLDTFENRFMEVIKEAL